MCILTNHPYRAAWVRLVRRVVMNTYVNQTGLLPFEYDSDEEDFKERFLLRSPTQHAKRKKRKRNSNQLKKGQTYRKNGEKGKSYINQLLASSTPDKFGEANGISDEQIRKEAVEGETTSSSPSELASVLPTQSSKESIKEKEIHEISSIMSDNPIYITFGTLEPANEAFHASKSEPEGWEIEADPDVQAEVCRLTVEVGNTTKKQQLDVCVDSGATFSMLSFRTYEKIKHHTQWVSKLAPADRCLHGASGANLNIVGMIGLAFRLDGLIYVSRLYVGNVVGVDALLGLPWLRKVGAVMHFGTMTIDLHPLHTVKLRTTQMIRHNAYAITTSAEEPYSRCHEGLIPETIHGFVRVVETSTIEAGTYGMVKCVITGRWEDGIDAHFTPDDHMQYPEY